jgi:hypothetical protein
MNANEKPKSERRRLTVHAQGEDFQVTILSEAIGVFFLGLFSLILLIALLRTERRNRQLLREIQATVVC